MSAFWVFVLLTAWVCVAIGLGAAIAASIRLADTVGQPEPDLTKAEVDRRIRELEMYL